jgi:hypothetical protein
MASHARVMWEQVGGKFITPNEEVKDYIMLSVCQLPYRGVIRLQT